MVHSRFPLESRPIARVGTLMSMTEDGPRRVLAEDWAASAATLGRAFASDPLLQHFLGPQAGQVDATEAFIRLSMEHVFGPQGEIWTMGRAQSVAVWARPGEWEPSEAAMSAIAGPLFELIGGGQLGVVVRAMEATAAAHPGGDHWYLAYLGTEPTLRRQGLASTVLQTVLTRGDAAGVGAYLESSRPENVPLYEKHGFRTMGSIEVPDEGPELTMMFREPQQRPA